jgi:integrase
MARPRSEPRPVNRRGFWYFVYPVPPEFASVEPRKRIENSTNIRVTSDPNGTSAKRAVEKMIEQLRTYWRRRLDGDTEAETPKFLADAIQVAANFDLPYLPASKLAEGDIETLTKRFTLLTAPQLNREIMFRGLLGGAKVPEQKTPAQSILVSGMLEELERIRAIDNRKKSPGQLKKWHGAKALALKHFNRAITHDKPLAELARNDVINFREQLQERIIDEEIVPETANKYIKGVGGMYNEIRRHHLLDLVNYFEGMTFPEDEERQRSAFTAEFIQKVILQTGLFDDLNPEARGIIYLMVETGLRPSEACNILPENIVLDTNIPHVKILPKNRELKTKESAREIPLIGCALMAMRANPNGFPRYIDKEASLSALLGKAFRARKLFPTDNHKVYSLRHTFKDRLRPVVEAKDEFINKMMGHACDEPKYGEGYPLDFKLSILEKIAFVPPERV